VSTKLGWFAILDARGLDVPALLTAVARDAPDDARPEGGFRVAAGEVCTVELLGCAFGHVDSWAQAVSGRSRRTTISFFLLEGLVPLASDEYERIRGGRAADWLSKNVVDERRWAPFVARIN
jgi:hypothetical protein